MEPLVLLHTLGSDHRMWDPVLPLLEGERDVIALDMPGFGTQPSLDEREPVTPARLATAVVAALRERGVERPHVAGNSLGGWVALEMGLAGAARSVTAIAPAGLWPQPLAPRRDLTRALARTALPLLGAWTRVPRLRHLAMMGTTAHPERVPPRAVAHLVRSYAMAPGFRAANRAMRASRVEGLADMPVPTTVAWCEHDRLVARRGLPPHIRTLVLRDCGHLPTYDAPGVVARVLLEGSAA
jgi:pimeloyl-ACP methyl ester carboxylesterase